MDNSSSQYGHGYQQGRVPRGPNYGSFDNAGGGQGGTQSHQPPVPSAPPLDMFQSVAGYENVQFGSGFNLPPPAYVPLPPSESPEQRFQQAAAISEEQARDAMLQFVSEHCCYGKAPAQEMVIKDIIPSSAYHYSLASFCESRCTEWKYEPYRGQPVDSPMNGPAPLPWDIPARPPQMFSEFKTKMEVPHTANIKPCHECRSSGYQRCYAARCEGTGRMQCSSCQGSGRFFESSNEPCGFCAGRGVTVCGTCNGHGRVRCGTCQGNAQLKTFIEMTIKWENHVSNFVSGRTEQLPTKFIVKSQGTEIFSQELPRVWPITTFHDQQINTGSRRLVEEHSSKWPNQRILLQRQVLRSVPVCEVPYQWKEASDRFWVYGHDHKVYAPDYPQQCCCGCSLL